MAMLGFDHHDLLAVRTLRFHLEVFAQPDVRNDLAANVSNVITVCVPDVFPGQFDALETVGKRQYEMRPADANQQPVDDCQCQRQAERYRKSDSWFTGDLDRSAQRFDTPADHVHAYS